jgi:hypothetical protein
MSARYPVGNSERTSFRLWHIAIAYTCRLIASRKRKIYSSFRGLEFGAIMKVPEQKLKTFRNQVLNTFSSISDTLILPLKHVGKIESLCYTLPN